MSGSTRSMDVLVVGQDRVVLLVASGPEADWERGWDQSDLSSLEAAVAELLRGGSRRPVTVLLLPPLAVIRRLDLPPMGPEDLARHVGPRGARYWSGAPALTLATQLRDLPRWFGLADAEVVEAIHRALSGEDRAVRAVLPAAVAWAARVAPGESLVVTVPVHGHHLVSRSADGGVARRRFPATPLGRLALDRVLGGLGETDPTWIGRPEESAATDPLLEASGWTAEGARRMMGEEGLVPLSVRDRRRRRLLHRAALLGAAAVAVLVTAGLTHRWGLQRELDSVRHQRAEIGSAVATALDVRKRTERIRSGLAVMHSLERSTPRWSVALAHVARTLPVSAHLTSFRGGGDTLAVEGEAVRAAEAVQGLRTVDGLRDLRASAPVRREAREGAAPVERFALTGRVTWPDLLSAVLTASSGAMASSEPAPDDGDGAP